MPGVIIHLIAGSALYFIGRYSFDTYFTDDRKLKKEMLFLFVCLFFSLIPDFFLALYYLTHLESISVLMSYQEVTHLYLTPLTIGLLIPIIIRDRKRRPLWIMAISALTLHLAMDLFAQSLHIHYGIFL
jgi:maltodextrin utilization protein YvdJ